MNTTIGVGILGAGPVVQAIHLPTLARLTDLFSVRTIMDVNAEVAAEVAGRVGALPVTSLDALLDDASVEVVAICSPQQFHAGQVIAAMRAGKKAVLCEKPLAVSREEAEQIAAISAQTGVPLIVGAMHTFDPAWLQALPFIDELRSEAHTIRSSIVLPFNDRFEDWATEVVTRPDFAFPDEMNAALRAQMMPLAVLGLAIHDLPLVRSFLPQGDALITSAEFIPPFGYAITLSVGETVADISGLMQPHWQPQWQFEAVSDKAHLHVDFTPSFVHAGSAVATYTDEQGTRVFGNAGHNGYEGEWRAVAAAARGDQTLVPPLEDLINDLVLAVDVAETSAALQLKETVH
ncbi:Gfo/Idh/MocA family oxidoreductase [Pseudarthrobacter phenanthrenivorans]|uniref:Gfo/Idh/MocA family protein n=1 Tax=Pseudarthrobacter phenanthrenivorans TaxID=361575 RepID=UPI00344BBA3C